MIQEIISIAAKAGFDLVPLINGTALNAKLDEYVNTMKDGMFIMLPEVEERRTRAYDHVNIATIEIVATSHTSFTNDDVVSAAEKYSLSLSQWTNWYRELYMI